MTLKQIFIQNLKEFRKKEGLSQMKMAENCGSSVGYIGEIEIGRKFPSVEMIEKIAKILRIEPYHLFRNRTENKSDFDTEISYPLLPSSMKKEIKKQINISIDQIFNKY